MIENHNAILALIDYSKSGRFEATDLHRTNKNLEVKQEAENGCHSLFTLCVLTSRVIVANIFVYYSFKDSGNGE